ncbi:hypothetical protein P7L54_10300 [Acinetobacter bereziniae]|uniref:hypothetical protein n=1 Tax=Acinetobacter bereziniae TaxID=106648 RepID=UPI0019033025|nr:hypothetical protein [Acinetobacter bereziniae]MDG3556341.1 hypothetical protein [Acinetobacter bereziniae]MDP6000437.1 hypothetical protein [Acinetobacter bereziniae]QQC79821.1 hypothetical protein I9192_17930 [Acinetobacter bereziniae]UUN92906.1 hypothetical protein I9189_017800 [Acinetobacter bereziniae]WMW73972.1 hypothetical protein RG306_17095 [Acinetobacter bereziniae]
MFEEREIKYLFPEDYEALSTSFLPNVVLKLKVVGKISYLDFGTIFFQNHTAVSRRTHYALVDKNSLFTGLISPLHEYMLDMAQKYSHASIKHFFKVIRNVVKDLYSRYGIFELQERSQALDIYKEYTQYLIIDRATKLKNSITDLGQYNRKQHVFAEILSRSLEIDIKEVKNSYIEIASKHKEHNIPVDEHKFKKFFQINETIFLNFSDFLINKKNLPIHIKNKNIDISFYEVFNNKKIERNNINKINKNNAKILNLAITAFINCFVSASALNTSQIYSLKVSDVKDLHSSTKGMRVITTKPRAGYKNIELTLPLKFRKLLLDYLNLREWIIKNYKFDDDIGESENLLFIGLNNTKAIYKDNFIIPYSENQHNIFRTWFIKKFYEIEWIPLSKLRSTIANIYHNESKNLNIVAKKLGNTPQIIASSYTEATESQVLTEMTNTFQSISTSALIISNTASTIRLNLANTLSTDMGHCFTKAPKLRSIYQNIDLDTPNCSNPISCLFCENYVIHTDKEDIHKLLSAKKVFEMANSNQNSENIFLVIQKINDVLDSILNNDPKNEQTIMLSSELITTGKLSPFFEIMLNTLTDLGVNFYE